MRAYCGIETIAIAIKAFSKPGPRMVTMAIASNKEGKAISTSMTRMMKLSAHPPKKPLTNPISVPTMMEINTAAKPTGKDKRTPYTTRLNSSRRFKSTP